MVPKIELPCMGCGAMMEFELTGEDEGRVAHPRPLCEGFASVLGHILRLHAVIKTEEVVMMTTKKHESN